MLSRTIQNPPRNLQAICGQAQQKLAFHAAPSRNRPAGSRSFTSMAPSRPKVAGVSEVLNSIRGL